MICSSLSVRCHSPQSAAVRWGREAPRRTSWALESDKLAAQLSVAAVAETDREGWRACTSRSVRRDSTTTLPHRLNRKVHTSALYNLISLSAWNVDDWGVISILWIDKIYQFSEELASHTERWFAAHHLTRVSWGTRLEWTLIIILNPLII